MPAGTLIAPPQPLPQPLPHELPQVEPQPQSSCDFLAHSRANRPGFLPHGSQSLLQLLQVSQLLAGLHFGAFGWRGALHELQVLQVLHEEQVGADWHDDSQPQSLFLAHNRAKKPGFLAHGSHESQLEATALQPPQHEPELATGAGLPPARHIEIIR